MDKQVTKSILHALSGVSLDNESKLRDVNTFQYGSMQLHTITMKTLGKLIFQLESKGDQTHFEQYIAKELSFLSSNSDLISGKYEGGLKIWEATEDLVVYMQEEKLFQSGKRYLDVGCGAGLIGIGALKSEPQSVSFMDFNPQVLQWFCLPNILLNFGSTFETEDQLIDWVDKKCDFYAGDWDTLTVHYPLLTSQKYDFILTAETIYSSESYSKLLSLIKRHLSADGSAYIAAKTHYFGVGGSVYDFEDHVLKDNCFNSVCVKMIEASVERQILKLTWK